MDADVKKEIKNRLMWFLSRPMFAWLAASMFLLWFETLFRGHSHYGYIALGFMCLYLFCMFMFMQSMEKAAAENMRYYENKNMPYITDMISKGLGSVTYMVKIGKPEGFIRRLRMRWFGVMYVCPYVATFLDTGSVHQQAHIAVPVNKRQQFQLKLMGCYRTKERERAEKALEYLGVEWPLP